MFIFDLGPSVKVKVMHISAANISNMVIHSADIIIASKHEVIHGLSLSILKFDLGPF